MKTYKNDILKEKKNDEETNKSAIRTPLKTEAELICLRRVNKFGFTNGTCHGALLGDNFNTVGQIQGKEDGLRLQKRNFFIVFYETIVIAILKFSNGCIQFHHFKYWCNNFLASSNLMYISKLGNIYSICTFY